MALSVTIRGNYYSSGSISFSSLRSNFRAQNLDGTFNTDNAQISASELKRVTDISNTDPTVPDAHENSSIATGNNLSLSQFRGSVKYYLLDQTGTNDNNGDNTTPGLNLSSLSSVSQHWDTNVSKTIVKSIGIAGTVGSYFPNQPAISLGDAANVTINVSGEVYGGGGQAAVNSGVGGSAILVSSSVSSTTRVNVTASAKIFAGGGAGGQGGQGGTGGTGGTGGSYPESKRTPGTGGSGGAGGPGGNGRGYNQSIGTGTVGNAGSAGGSGTTLSGSDVRGGSSDNIPFRYPQLGTGNNIRTFAAGNGGQGGTGGVGGDGGDWGQDGGLGNTGSTGNTGASSSEALFLNIASAVSSISYSASSNAGHTNRFYIRGILNIAASGEGNNFNGSTGSAAAGVYGPVESYDISIGNNPNGIYKTSNANMYADDNGASGDDANDLMIFLGGGTNVQLVYQSFTGSSGTVGSSGGAGKSKGSAVGGTNVTLISSNVTGDIVKGSVVSLTDP